MLPYSMCIRIVSQGQNSGAEQKTAVNKIVFEVIIWTDPIVKASYVAACLIAKKQNHLLVVKRGM